MPSVYKITVKGMPSEAFLRSDDRQRFRNIVGGRMRRHMQKLQAQASARTPFPEFKDYFVEQRTEGDTLSFRLGNRNPDFVFMDEPTRQEIGPKRFPPWKQGTPLADWARRHNANPFLVARHIFRFGTKGHRILQTLWDQSADDLDRTINEAVDSFAKAFAESSLAMD